MKKQLLILFAFISVLALSQVPQRFNKVIVTGDITSPKFIRTNSNADSVLLGNGSARAISTIKTDTVSLSNRINTKQETLVSGTNIRTVNGNSVLGSGDIQIASGGGGSPANNYLSNVNSSVSGYKELRPDIDVAETVKTITATPANAITWGEKYLYTSPVSTTVIPSGFWELHAYGHISTSTGVSKLVFRVLRYSAGVETVLATFTGFEVNNTTDAEIFVNGSTNDITVVTGDYLGIQVGFLSDGTSPARTLTYTIGNGHATHFNTPLPTRHSSLRDKNGEVDFQHLTAAQVSKVDATSGTNTGDETLTSIKTKLGAATSVSDGYLKYQDLNAFNSKEPAFSKNSGFNKNFGTTAGTVLEGRTFGTAANSAVGDFIQSQNSSAQPANMWINGDVIGDNKGKFGSLYRSVEFRSLLSDYGSSAYFGADSGADQRVYRLSNKYNNGGTDFVVEYSDAKPYGTDFASHSYSERFRISKTGAANFSSTVNATQFDATGSNAFNGYNEGWLNLYSSDNSHRLRINNSTTYNRIDFYDHTLGRYADIALNVGEFYGQIKSNIATGTAPLTVNSTTMVGNLNADLLDGNHASAFQPAITGLTTNYLPKWNGSSFVNANAGTDYQLPITLTTNGTSGAATLTGTTLNIPNYTSGIVNQTQTTVNGSTSGSVVCSMPFQTGSYKKVLIWANNILGSATYIFPTPFTNPPTDTKYVSGMSWNANGITITTSSAYTGWFILEGY